MTKKIRLTHFKKEFGEREIFESLTNVISIENIKQKGKDLLKFIYLVNQKKSKINKLFFLDTTYLYRYYDVKNGLIYKNYDATKRNLRPVSEWERNEQKYLNLLQLDYEIITWYHLVHTDVFKKWQNLILDVFKESDIGKEFRTITDDIVIEYAKKGDKESVVGFLLEECAGGLAAIEIYGDITYPGPLNNAILYWVTKSNFIDKFYPYRISSASEDLNRQFLQFT